MNKLFLLVFLSFVVSANSATYYVDYATGSDANNGTTTGTPWQHEPGDVNATGTADGTTLAAGDTVIFKGGVVYLGGVICNRSGSFGSPITYDGNSAGTWGTGKAIIDRQYLLNGAGIAASGTRGHIVIRNFEIRNVGGWADDATNVLSAAAGTYTNSTPANGKGIDFYTDSGHTNIYVTDCYFQRIGGWRNTIGWTTETVNGNGAQFRNSGLVTITNCEFTKMHNPIGIFSQSGGYSINWNVVSNDMHNYICWGITIGSQSDGSVFMNLNIHKNKIRDYGEFVSGNWEGAGEWPHTDGIFLQNSGTKGAWTNINIYQNQWYCDGDLGAGGTASIFVSAGPSCNIYSNLFNNDSQTRYIGVSYNNIATNLQVVVITNNTFIGAKPFISIDGESNVLWRRVTILNNIFRQVAGGAQNANMITCNSDNTDPYVWNYNLYYDPDWSAAAKYSAHFRGAYKTFAEVQAYGFEANGFYDDADFVSLSGTPSLTDSRLQSTSPARNAGQDGGDVGWLPFEVENGVTQSATISTGVSIKAIRR